MSVPYERHELKENMANSSNIKINNKVKVITAKNNHAEKIGIIAAVYAKKVNPTSGKQENIYDVVFGPDPYLNDSDSKLYFDGDLVKVSTTGGRRRKSRKSRKSRKARKTRRRH